MARTKRGAADLYQLKVTLLGSKPPIWRRLQVSGDVTLYQLRHILQIAFDWTESHLHQFVVDDTFYGEPAPDLLDLGPPTEDEGKVRLQQVAPGPKDRFVYEYDFGDSWEHGILVEKTLPPVPEVHYPRCITGKRAAPPDDCGGVWGYYELLEALADPDHTDHEDLTDWLGDPDFDPEAFSPEVVNERLSTIR